MTDTEKAAAKAALDFVRDQAHAIGYRQGARDTEKKEFELFKRAAHLCIKRGLIEEIAWLRIMEARYQTLPAGTEDPA